MFRTESFPYACVPLVEREREREREEKHRSNELWRESSRENSSAFRSFDSENGKEAERALDKLLRVIFVSPNFLNQRSSRNIFEFANARVDSRHPRVFEIGHRRIRYSIHDLSTTSSL